MLENYGFEEVGNWSPYAQVKSGVNFNLTKSEQVIYAFVVSKQVKYIGICEKTSLKERLSEYKNRTTEREKEIAFDIKRSLDAGHDVKILALKPNLGFKFKDLDVDCIRGLEYPLIAKFNPEWNRKKK